MPIALQRNYMRFGLKRLIPSPTAETLHVGPFAKLLRHAEGGLEALCACPFNFRALSQEHELRIRIRVPAFLDA
jgi:hypothetical protein